MGLGVGQTNANAQGPRLRTARAAAALFVGKKREQTRCFSRPGQPGSVCLFNFFLLLLLFRLCFNEGWEPFLMGFSSRPPPPLNTFNYRLSRLSVSFLSSRPAGWLAGDEFIFSLKSRRGRGVVFVNFRKTKRNET